MNIFYLHTDPVEAARTQFDRHVVKMIVETAQLLSTAHHELDGGRGLSQNLYKPAYVKHPSAVWVRQSLEHYMWLYDHFTALCDEYTRRYGKVHKTAERLCVPLRTPPVGIPDAKWVDPPQCMPDRFKDPNDTVQAYRNYYQHGKEEWLHVWKYPATRPDWFGGS